MHLFGHNRDHDYYSRLLREEERDAQSITRCFVHTIACSGLSRVRTELFQLLVPSSAPKSAENELPAACVAGVAHPPDRSSACVLASCESRPRQALVCVARSQYATITLSNICHCYAAHTCILNHVAFLVLTIERSPDMPNTVR